MLTLGNFENLPSAGRLRFFSEKLKETVKCFLTVLEKQAMKLVQPSKDQFLSTCFLVLKKDTENRPVINLKKLNRNIPCEHFKIEGITFPGNKGQNYFTMSIILKEK